LWTWNHFLEVGILAALLAFDPTFSGALNATLFLVQLLLSTESLSLAFFHAVSPKHVEICGVF
jgi:hypothetical protein